MHSQGIVTALTELELEQQLLSACPLLLMGYSLGSFVAHQVAVMLEQRLLESCWPSCFVMMAVTNPPGVITCYQLTGYFVCWQLICRPEGSTLI